MDERGRGDIPTEKYTEETEAGVDIHTCVGTLTRGR